MSVSNKRMDFKEERYRGKGAMLFLALLAFTNIHTYVYIGTHVRYNTIHARQLLVHIQIILQAYYKCTTKVKGIQIYTVHYTQLHTFMYINVYSTWTSYTTNNNQTTFYFALVIQLTIHIHTRYCVLYNYTHTYEYTSLHLTPHPKKTLLIPPSPIVAYCTRDKNL